MTRLMEKAIAAIKSLPEQEQDALAQELLDRLDEESEWSRLVGSPKSQAWMAEAAREALAEHDRGETTAGLPKAPKRR